MSGHTLTPHATATAAGKRRWLVTCSCGWYTGQLAKTADAAIKIGHDQHLDRQRPPCPTPHKRGFRTSDTATRELATFWRTSGKGKTMPCRVYECQCGRWHTTSKPLRVAR